MYESFFGLSGNPFQLSPDPAFYYGSPVHRRAYAYLEYGLYQGEGFIVITGEVGAGKTTLVRNLLAHVDPRQVTAAHLVSTNLDADELLRAVASALGLATTAADKPALLADLERHLRRLAGERRHVLLVVDEAQNLTARAVEELRMLSNYQLGGKALLQSFLVGQPELRKTLQGPDMQQFRQRVIASYHLGALDKNESQAYVEHRLKQVGWKRDPAFDDDAFEAIYAFTAGIPRRINLVCNRLLLAAFLSEKHDITAADVELVARELREEFGVVSASPEDSTGPAAPRPEAAPAKAASAETEGSEAAESGDGLQTRVARLETTHRQLQRLLGRVLRILEPRPR